MAWQAGGGKGRSGEAKGAEDISGPKVLAAKEISGPEMANKARTRARVRGQVWLG